MIAIDLGSNTIRVLEYDCTTHKELSGYSKVVKTADGLISTNIIDDKAIDRVIDALKEAQEIIDFSSHQIKAVTTEALRRANNSDYALDKIKSATGVEFEIISGDEEARLTLLAVEFRLDKLNHSSDNFVVIDIGGGSTEVIFKYKDETISQSFSIGIVTIAQKYSSLQKIEENLPKDMRDIREFAQKVVSTKGKVGSFVGTAGTPTTLASMKLGMVYATYDASQINGTTLKFDELKLYLNELLSLEAKQREIVVGVGRYDLILAGILIYAELFHILDFDECIVVDDGLREGVAIDWCRY